jgi:hypothetical protein
MTALVFPVAPTDGDVFGQYIFDGTKEVWRLTPDTPNDSNLENINNVTIVTPENGDVLTYSDGDWVSQAIVIAETRPHPFTMIG